MRVSEVFDSIQGEGPLQGRAATFIRFTGCNLQCPWCDTPQKATGNEMTLEEMKQIKVRQKLVVITGGEPLCQDSPTLLLYVKFLLSAGIDVQIETNGTKYLELPPPVYVVISPKPYPGGGVDPTSLALWANRTRRGRTWFKFVIIPDGHPIQPAFSIDDAYLFIQNMIPNNHTPAYVIAEGVIPRLVVEHTKYMVEWLTMYPYKGNFILQIRSHIILNIK